MVRVEYVYKADQVLRKRQVSRLSWIFFLPFGDGARASLLGGFFFLLDFFFHIILQSINFARCDTSLKPQSQRACLCISILEACSYTSLCVHVSIQDSTVWVAVSAMACSP